MKRQPCEVLVSVYAIWPGLVAKISPCVPKYEESVTREPFAVTVFKFTGWTPVCALVSTFVPMATEMNPTEWCQVIDRYFKEAAAPSLQEFLEVHADEIARLIQPGEDVKGLWTSRYAIAAQKKKIPFVTKQPNWSTVALKAIEIFANNGSCSTSPSLPSASGTSGTSGTSTKTLPVDLAVVESRYASIPNGSAWILSTGKNVEETMKRRALSCSSEHPCHSMILDVSDSLWTKDNMYFTEAEMNEIKAHNSPELPEIPVSINEYLERYNNKYNKEDIFQVAKHEAFHPTEEPDLKWAHMTILRALYLFFDQYLPLTDHTEQDVMNRVWGFVQECFDGSEFVVRCGEKTSASSSEARNAERSISGEALARKSFGKRVDMLIKCTTQEFACAEAGKSQVNDTTKELVESSLICPKTIRDMLCKLASPNPSKLHEIVTVGFIFTGTKMTCLVMTCPAGNVCRVQRIGPLFFPDSDQNFVSRMKALIRVVWKMRAILKSSLMVVSREDQDFDPDFEHPGFKCPILPSYHHQQRPAKRRKVSKAEINSEATNSHDNQV